LARESLSAAFAVHPVFLLAGAAPAEFWRTFSEYRYQRYSCNERNHGESISLMLPDRGWAIRTLPSLIAARSIPGSKKSWRFRALGRRAISWNAGSVKSLDTSIAGSATTRCNAHARRRRRYTSGVDNRF